MCFYILFIVNNEKKEVTLPEGNWNVCINDTLAGTDTIETISGTAEVAPVSALILVKGVGNGSTAVASAGTLPAWMAYVSTFCRLFLPFSVTRQNMLQSLRQPEL